MILYLHGFTSGPQSVKARALGARMAARGLAADFVCPQLPASPAEAIALAEQIILRQKVGTPRVLPTGRADEATALQGGRAINALLAVADGNTARYAKKAGTALRQGDEATVKRMIVKECAGC